MTDNQDFFENLKDYFKKTPRDQVLKDWEECKEFDNVGPTVDEYLKNLDKYYITNNKFSHLKDETSN